MIETGGRTYYPWNPSQPPAVAVTNTAVKQLTRSENHFWPRAKDWYVRQNARFPTQRKLQPDVGGDFYTKVNFYDEGNCHFREVFSKIKTNGVPTYKVAGNLAPTTIDFSATDLAAKPSSDNNLDVFGSKAISAVVPTKPAADLAVSLAEVLREGIPSMLGSALFKSRLRDFRKIGDEYLNVAFGWVPLVGGVQDVVNAYANSERILLQLQRDSGRVVRRRFKEPITRTLTTVNLTNAYPRNGINTYMCTGGPYKRDRVIETTRERWFSGAFTYHLALNDGALNGFLRGAQEAKKLYGIKLDPEVLWNLTPWSWAADWFVNGGTLASNLSSFSQDGLVMRYGYVMETTTVKYTDTMYGVQLNGHPTTNLSHSYGTTVKVRRRATPYGFGLDFDGFSTYQLGIMAALGLTNVPQVPDKRGRR